MRTSHAFLMLTLLLFSATSSLLAQQKQTITGTVTDSKGGIVIGVTVLEKGTRNATFSDANGFYRLSVAPSATLVFTYVGFAKKEVAVGANTSIDVTMQEDSRSLNEVVVTGFGESRAKRNLGYAVTQVSGDDIRKTAAVNPIAALQGMVAGLQVSPNVGGPQASVRFQIRGSASLDPYKNTPLIVVDDIVMDDNVVLPNRGGEQDFGNILKDINPDDIESISVLKGGAVTALYGSKASNGVILIRTKKGFSQKGLGVSFSHSMMFERAYKTVDLQNRFGGGIHGNDWNKGLNDTLEVDPTYYYYGFGPEMKGQMFKDFSGKYRANTTGYNDVLDLYETGINRNTNIGISGGNDKTTFRFSYSNLGAKSATPNNGLDRNSFSFRGTHRPGKGVLLDVNTSYTTSVTKNPAFQGGNSLLYATSYGVPRNYDINYWRSNYVDTTVGGYTNRDISDASNAFWALEQNAYEQRENSLRAGLNLRADLTPWLRFEGSTSLSTFGTDYTAKVRGKDAGFNGGDYTTSNISVKQYRHRGSLNFIKKLGVIDLLVQGGGEFNQSKQSGLWSSANGLVTPDLFRLINSRDRPETREEKEKELQTGSLFFQSSIGFRDYLTLNLYGRNDWNSSLVYPDGHGDYSYFYPGADLAFVFTDLFKLPKAVDFGKLRLSYVEAGGGTDAYNTSTGSYTSAGVYTDASGASILRYGFTSGTLGNPNLVPVRNAKMEAGLEFKMFSNRLGGDVTVYRQDSKNQIQAFLTPPESGASKALVNGGKVRNQGIEISLFGTPVKTTNFSWDVLFNYTRNRNTIVSLALGAKFAMLDEGDNIYSVGQPGGEYGAIRAPYAYASYQAKDGSGNNTSSPLNGLPVVGFDAAGGRLGDPVVYYLRAGSYNGLMGGTTDPVIGSTLPKFLGSLRNTFNYKRLALSVFLDSKIGGDVYSTTLAFGSQYGMINRTLPGRTTDLGGLKYTSKSNYNGQAPGDRFDGIVPQGVFAAGTVIPANVSGDGVQHDVGGMTVAEALEKKFIKPNPAPDYYDRTYGWQFGIRQASMFESSWVSVREISLTYDLPQGIANKLKLNNLRASVIGRNLFFLYNSAPDGVNPDNLSSTSSGAFIENGGTPYFRQFGFSLNTNF
ncbi:SusC/RagA family TonB-linked outer membrane protein [Chitinophaga sp. SYP-B3965]|uniref:SusC/RagA family TonB-linked outer membrane protein n=1 Tax=Chitinophaga sp. SYP-B3965 TaxID=2663120 RepID=UPI001299911F|nr:SusC/RagA family TonB-linked outer membrane protein [Chitinophaga sp. SYP-B3965]MRG43571.1 SusC/RagA family TonB-linked outer membrane protein [Chitinophaga sp. SYP-B3965]